MKISKIYFCTNVVLVFFFVASCKKTNSEKKSSDFQIIENTNKKPDIQIDLLDVSSYKLVSENKILHIPKIDIKTKGKYDFYTYKACHINEIDNCFEGILVESGEPLCGFESGEYKISIKSCFDSKSNQNVTCSKYIDFDKKFKLDKNSSRKLEKIQLEQCFLRNAIRKSSLKFYKIIISSEKEDENEYCSNIKSKIIAEGPQSFAHMLTYYWPYLEDLTEEHQRNNLKENTSFSLNQKDNKALKYFAISSIIIGSFIGLNLIVESFSSVFKDSFNSTPTHHSIKMVRKNGRYKPRVAKDYNYSQIEPKKTAKNKSKSKPQIKNSTPQKLSDRVKVLTVLSAALLSTGSLILHFGLTASNHSCLQEKELLELASSMKINSDKLEILDNKLIDLLN